MPIQNILITTGGVAQSLNLPQGCGGIILNPIDENCWINFGTTNAAVNVGELVYKGSPTKFSYHEFPELNAGATIFSATTGSHLTLRPIS